MEKAFAPPHSDVMREGNTFSTGVHAQRVLKHGMEGFDTESFKASEVFYGFQSTGCREGYINNKKD